MIWLKLGWRNLFRNKRRTIIEISSIAGSVLLGIWWNNLAVGTYEKMIDDGVRMGSGHIGIYHREYLELRKTEQIIAVDDLVAELERDPDVAAVYPRLMVPGLLRSSRDSRPTAILGIDFAREQGSNPLLDPKRIVEGSLPEKPREAVIGKVLAQELGLSLGKKFVFMAQGSDGDIVSTLLRVSGIIESHVREIDNATVLIDREHLGEIIGYTSSAHEIGIILHNNRLIKRAFPRIERIVNHYENARPFTWEEAMPELSSAVRLDHAGLQVMVVLLYLIVGIGTVNTILMSVIERTREFGVFRAIGLNSTGIRKMVMSEALVLAFAGVTVGLIVGSLLSTYTAVYGIDFSRFMSEQGFGGTIFEPIMYGGWDIRGMIYLSGGMIVVALIASLYPTYWVMKIRPSDAMRRY